MGKFHCSNNHKRTVRGWDLQSGWIGSVPPLCICVTVILAPPVEFHFANDPKAGPKRLAVRYLSQMCSVRLKLRSMFFLNLAGNCFPESAPFFLNLLRQFSPSRGHTIFLNRFFFPESRLFPRAVVATSSKSGNSNNNSSSSNSSSCCC